MRQKFEVIIQSKEGVTKFDVMHALHMEMESMQLTGDGQDVDDPTLTMALLEVEEVIDPFETV